MGEFTLRSEAAREDGDHKSWSGASWGSSEQPSAAPNIGRWRGTPPLSRLLAAAPGTQVQRRLVGTKSRAFQTAAAGLVNVRRGCKGCYEARRGGSRAHEVRGAPGGTEGPATGRRGGSPLG